MTPVEAWMWFWVFMAMGVGLITMIIVFAAIIYDIIYKDKK